MKFFDEVQITVKSGAGGDGLISGRREKHVPFGGPSGGNGGEGGSVIIQGTTNEWTLMKYRYNIMYKAKDGEKGGSSEQYGRNAEDIILTVPLGTLIKDTDTGAVIGHISQQDQEITIASGGRGGVGNMHFVTPQVQYPEIALHGEPGHTKKITLELQLLADVALIGLPSVGKSSLINAISNVKAKTAEYHFTTLIPNIGIIEHKKKSFVMIDVPGLIQGASAGKGLGSEFLRHILKSRVLCFVLDIGKYESGRKDFSVLFQEFTDFVRARYPRSSLELVKESGKLYIKVTDAKGDILMKKALLWVLNKQDLLGDEELIDEYMNGWVGFVSSWLSERNFDQDAGFIQQHTSIVSAATRSGVDAWLDKLITATKDEEIVSIVHHESPNFEKKSLQEVRNCTGEELQNLQEQGYLPEGLDQKKMNVREVVHAEIAYLSFVVPWGNDQAELRYRRQLQQQGHMQRLESFGVKKGDILKVHSEYHGVPDKYILRE